jgi:HEAT repeat protein
MTTFFCPSCWREFPESTTTCPHCHANITGRLWQANYVEKLITALDHKEPTTPVRAAWILGERREKKAVSALARVVHKASDAFLVESAVEALGKIGGRTALASVRAATRHSSLRVRVKAREMLMKIINENAAGN